jgi:hypothetical protein
MGKPIRLSDSCPRHRFPNFRIKQYSLRLLLNLSLHTSPLRCVALRCVPDRSPEVCEFWGTWRVRGLEQPTCVRIEGKTIRHRGKAARLFQAGS